MEKTKNKSKNKEEWIEQDLKSKIPRIDKKTIYIPSENELHF
jgi:hypothetical protein